MEAGFTGGGGGRGDRDLSGGCASRDERETRLGPATRGSGWTWTELRGKGEDAEMVVVGMGPEKRR